jgi:hypothetical protein
MKRKIETKKCGKTTYVTKLSPLSRVLLGKLIVAELVKIFLVF